MSGLPHLNLSRYQFPHHFRFRRYSDLKTFSSKVMNDSQSAISEWYWDPSLVNGFVGLPPNI